MFWNRLYYAHDEVSALKDVWEDELLDANGELSHWLGKQNIKLLKWAWHKRTKEDEALQEMLVGAFDRIEQMVRTKEIDALKLLRQNVINVLVDTETKLSKHRVL